MCRLQLPPVPPAPQIAALLDGLVTDVAAERQGDPRGCAQLLAEGAALMAALPSAGELQAVYAGLCGAERACRACGAALSAGGGGGGAAVQPQQLVCASADGGAAGLNAAPTGEAAGSPQQLGRWLRAATAGLRRRNSMQNTAGAEAGGISFVQEQQSQSLQSRLVSISSFAVDEAAVVAACSALHPDDTGT